MTPEPAIARVLVVDDNVENHALAKAALEEEDVPVVLAATGEEAIAAFSRGPAACVRIWVEDGAPGAAFCIRLGDAA